MYLVWFCVCFCYFVANKLSLSLNIAGFCQLHHYTTCIRSTGSVASFINSVTGVQQGSEAQKSHSRSPQTHDQNADVIWGWSPRRWKPKCKKTTDNHLVKSIYYIAFMQETRFGVIWVQLMYRVGPKTGPFLKFVTLIHRVRKKRCHFIFACNSAKC